MGTETREDDSLVTTR